MVNPVGINIIHLFTDYHTSVKFFYPIMLLLFLTFFVTFHSRKYKKVEDEEVIHMADIKIENTNFLRELNLIKSGDFSSYLSEIRHDMENTNQIMKDYRLTVKKYHKYDMKSRSSTGIMRKHAIRMRDQCLQHILDDYEAIKKIKMDVINEEVYKEWKQKQKT